MTGESIGTARLDIVVDTSQFDTAITAAKRSVSGMSQAAQEEYNKLNGAEKRRIDSLIKQADTLGFTRQQQILYSAALKNTPTNVLDELKKKLAGTGEAAAKAGIQLNQYGISSKQTAAAMRGVPAQITDIFTSLQGGQKPITVLLQQGGQLKDMFGGIRPAAAALGGQLLAMVNPLTVTAALVGALAFAWKQASDEQLAFSNALITTGNFAGKNASDLSELVDQLDRLDGVTRGGATDALTQVAASGRFAGQQFDLVADAAARMEAATGQTIDKTVAKFAELQKGPVDALLKLNETEHFLTQAQLDRVSVLQDEKREQEAAGEAIRIYAEHLDEVARKAQEAKPALTGLWTDIKDETSAAWGEIKTYMSLVAEAAALRTKFLSSDAGAVGAFAESFLPSSRLRWVTDRARAQLAEMQGTQAFQTSSGSRGKGGGGVIDSAEAKRARDERKKAEDEWNRWQDQNLDKKGKQQQEEAKIIAIGKKLGLDQAKIDEQLVASRKRFAESMAKSERKGVTKTDPTEAIIARIKQQIALNEAQLEAEEKLSTSERLRVQVQTELERLGGKATGTRRAEIASLLDQVVASGKLADAHIQEKKALEDLGRLKTQLAAAELNQGRANEIDLMAIGRGGNAADMLRRQLDIQRELEDGLDRIQRDAKDKTKDQLAEEEAALRDSIGRRLEMERNYQKARAAMQEDWKNGAIKAYEDYVEASKNVAGQVEDMWNEAFSTIEDIGVDALSGNLKSWDDYFENLHQMILRFIVKQQLTKWMESLAGNGTGDGSGGWLAALFGGSGSGSNDAGSLMDLFSGDWGFKKGGAFAGGVQTFAKGGAFTNQVVTQPTQFRFAKGIGLMGEAGPEAIMPLKRGRDGKLGVAAEAAPARGGDSYHITIPVQGGIDHRTKGQVANETARQVRIAARNGA